MPETEEKPETVNDQIVELNDLQVSILMAAANGSGKVFVALFPNSTDNETDRKQLEEQLNDLRHLVKHGFMTDITSDFADTVKMTKASHNRDTLVVSITPLAEKMFRILEGKDLVN